MIVPVIIAAAAVWMASTVSDQSLQIPNAVPVVTEAAAAALTNAATASNSNATEADDLGEGDVVGAVQQRQAAVIGHEAGLLWDRLPRTNEDFALVLVEHPEQADATELLRSRTFNPRDLQLDATQCDRFHDTLEIHRPSIDRARDLMKAAFHREFSAAVARGESIGIRFGNTLEPPLFVLGSCPFVGMVGSEARAVARSSMPDSVVCERDLRVLGRALVAHLAAASLANGCLSTVEHADLLARARRVEAQQ